MEPSSKQKRMNVLEKLRELVRDVKKTFGGNLRPEVNNYDSEASDAAQRGSSTKQGYTKYKESVGDKMVTSTLNIYHCNVRSIGNRKKSIDDIIRANDIDICFI